MVPARPVRGVSRRDPALLSQGDVLVRLEPDLGRAQIFQLAQSATLGSATSVEL